MGTSWIWVLALVALWLVLKRAKARYRVQATLTVEASEADTLAAITDFRQWPAWSPWLLHEPDCPLRMERPDEVGGHYEWNGQRIGAGRITFLPRPDAHTVPTELRFLRPFKASAAATFTTRALDGGHTEVQWVMDGELPLLLAPMRGKLREMITLDFELGLARLAGHLYPTATHPVITFEPPVDRPSFTAMSAREATTLAQLPEVYRRLMPLLGQRAGAAVNDAPLGVYHRINAQSGAVDLEVAFPVAEGTPGAKLIRGGYYARVVLKGDYRFLKLAWHAAYGHARMDKHKWDAQSPALERYLIGPDQSPNSNDWVTELYVPIREK